MKKLFFQESLLSSYLDTDNNDFETIKSIISKISLKKEDFVKDYLKRHNDILEKDSEYIKEITRRILGYKLNSIFDTSGKSIIMDELPKTYDEYIKEYYIIVE